MGTSGFSEIRAYGLFDQYDSDEEVPDEFCLLKQGDNDTMVGKLLFDEESARLVMQNWQARGIELMADYEHMSLEKPPVPAPASAKKWTPEVRNGALWATAIAWTAKARSMIAAGEYRYFSIACQVEKKTNRVSSVINFALTNTPAANSLTPLMAASIAAANKPQEIAMNTVLVALGLKPDAQEAEAVVAVGALKEFERDISQITGKSGRAETLGALRAMAQSHDQVVALSARVKQLESDVRGREFDALVKQGQDSAQISPAMAAGDWIKHLRDKEDGALQLTAFLATAPKLVSVGEAAKEPAPAAAQSTVALSADDKKIAARMGVKPEDLMKNKARRMQMASIPADDDDEDAA